MWAWLESGSNRGVLAVWAGGTTRESAAERLGYAVFRDEAELAAKLALGSSVGLASDDRLLRINVKSLSDVTGSKGEALEKLLRESWQAFTCQVPA